MSGRGFGNNNINEGRRKLFRESIHGISNPAIRRIARRGGVKRMCSEVYDEIRYVLKKFIEDVVRDAIVYTEFSRRKTVSQIDILLSVKRRGKTLLGFDPV